MAKKEDLIKEASELGIPGLDPDMTNDQLQTAINDFKAEKEAEEAAAQEDEPEVDENEVPFEPAENLQNGVKYYRSTLPGLSVAVEEPEQRSDLLNEIHFQPVEHWNEQLGDHYKLGYLATDEPNAIEILADDQNVTEITWEQYWAATELGERR